MCNALFLRGALMIYFDNAATSGVKPPEVINAVTNALKNYSINPGRSGYVLSLKTAEKIYKTLYGEFDDDFAKK